MWFKNLIAYRFLSPFETSAEALEEQLQQGTFTPCGKRDLSQYGWVSPLSSSQQLCHSANGFLMVCARKEEKLLPASVIKELVDDKVSLIEEAEARKVYRKERDGIKEEILFDCLPQAFTRSSRTFAYIDPRNGWLVVDAASSKKAEELTSYLRETLGSLPIALPQLNNSIPITLTQWLTETPPAGFVLGEECELREAGEDGGIVRYKQQDLSTEEISLHIEYGKQAHKLAIEWNEQIKCIIDTDLSMKRLSFNEQLVSEAEEAGAEDAAAKFDADFALMTATLASFLKDLLIHLGGEKQAI